jgi:hypothetical protein
MNLSQTLMQLEHSLLSQDTRRDAAAISRLIAEDFIEFGASGSIWTKAQVVEQLPQQPFTQRTTSEFSAKPLSEHTVLVTYRCHNLSADRQSSTHSLRSSIWRKRGEEWEMVFHQGTPIPQ